MSKVETERGIGRALSPYDIRTNAPVAVAGSDWFGPGLPIRSVAPPEVAGRSWDYQPGFNLQTQPRSQEPISFEALRAIADAFDPVRLIVEKRKDQVTRLPWKIRAKHDGPGKRPKDAELSAQIRGIIRDVKEFFDHPAANDLSFRSWLRMLLDDLLVLDAPAIYCEHDDAGNLVALSPVDGATIRVVIDENGRPAREFRWNGKPFQWCGETVTVSNYAALGFKITRGLLWPPTYAQSLKGGTPVGNFTSWDLLYRPMNLRTNGVYGHSPVSMIATTVNIAMRRALGQLEYFREGNMPEGVYGLPETWTVDQVTQFQDWWDSLFVGNLGRRRQMRFLAGDGKFTPFKEPPLKTEFDEWLMRIVCFAFSYPPAAFVSLQNRSIAEQHEKQAEEEGIEPLKNWVSELINDVIERELDQAIEFAWIEENEVDQEKQAKILRGYATDGILSINEVRERLGEEPLPDKAANTPMVKTANGYIPITSEPADAAEEGDADKLAKGGIIMLPPANWVPRVRFSVAGTTFIPNLQKRELLVFSEVDAIFLETEGWLRKPV